MNRPVVGLVALGAALVAVLLVTLTREQRREWAEPVGDSVPIADESVAPAPAPVAETLAGTPETAAVTTPARPPSQREAVPDAVADELARAHWVEGRVVFPANTPPDEEAFVVARGREFSDGEVQRAHVGSDGRFRVAFAESTKSGWIVLEARYLYLEANVRWKRGEGAGEPLVLEPRLGARLTGRLVPPARVQPASVGGEVKLDQVQRNRSGSLTTQHEERGVELSLAFEFGGLPADSAYRVVYEGDELVGSATETEVEAGRTAHVEIELERGCVLSGHVVDESGAGVGGIKVMANVEAAARIGLRSDESESDGAFRITGLPGGKASLLLQTSGYAEARYGVGMLETGEEREGLEIVLRRGNSIAGRVQWPDGTPAEANLEAVSEEPWKFGAPVPIAKNRAMSAADGTFLIPGLGAGPYTIRATAKRLEEVPEWSEMLGRERTRKKAAWLKASAEHVAVGTSDLVLILSAGLELEGRVVDDLGAPVRSFRLSASRVRTTVRVDGSDSLGRSVQSVNGTFLLDGLSAGSWELTASADGYGGGQPLRLSIPAAEPIVVTLPREARVHGIVVDPAGLAVRDARVTWEQSMLELRLSDDGSTDERGVFELAGLQGTVAITATAGGWAPSAPLLLELAPGEVRTDVMLHLGQGCWITGEVRDRSGAAVGNVEVTVSGWDSDYFESYPAEADGRFEFSGVPPGDVSVSAEMLGGLELEEHLTLAAGESAHVVLAPRSTAVRLHGRVLLGGEPLAGARLDMRRDDGSGGASAQCDDAGQYEVELDGPGRYAVQVYQGYGGTHLWATVDVPEVEDFALDIVRGMGRISGSVRDEDGRPLEGVTVEVDPSQGREDFGASARCDTGHDGRYELAVPAATYVVKAGGDTWRSAAHPAYVEAHVDDVVVAEDQTVRGIDLVLVRGGILKGVVRSAEPVRWSMLSIAPADGSAPASYLGSTDENGSFRIEGVARGSWLVAAASESMLSTWERVDIEPGTERAIELELSPATWLVVRPRAADGAPETAIHVIAEDGRTYATSRDDEELAYWAGPFHPGRYQVRAERDGRVTERTVEIAGGQERMELELVLD